MIHRTRYHGLIVLTVTICRWVLRDFYFAPSDISFVPSDKSFALSDLLFARSDFSFAPSDISFALSNLLFGPSNLSFTLRDYRLHGAIYRLLWAIYRLHGTIYRLLLVMYHFHWATYRFHPYCFCPVNYCCGSTISVCRFWWYPFILQNMWVRQGCSSKYSMKSFCQFAFMSLHLLFFYKGLKCIHNLQGNTISPLIMG